MLRKPLAVCILLLIVAVTSSATEIWRNPTKKKGVSDGLTIIGDYSEKLYVDKTGKIIASFDDSY